MTEKQLLAKAMGFLGSRSSPAKSAAVRENGKLGGRPRSVSKRLPRESLSEPRGKRVVRKVLAS